MQCLLATALSTVSAGLLQSWLASAPQLSNTDTFCVLEFGTHTSCIPQTAHNVSLHNFSMWHIHPHDLDKCARWVASAPTQQCSWFSGAVLLGPTHKCSVVIARHTYPHDLHEDVLRILRNHELRPVVFSVDGDGLQEDVDPWHDREWSQVPLQRLHQRTHSTHTHVSSPTFHLCTTVRWW